MHVDRTALLAGVVPASAAALSNVVAVAVIAGVPFHAGTSATLLASGLNSLVTIGMLLVVPAAAFYLGVPEERTAGPVVAGFAVGAVLYGAGVSGVLWAAPTRFVVPGGFHRFGTWLALLYGGAAALGALGADTLVPLFRAPEGEDGEHPRW